MIGHGNCRIVFLDPKSTGGLVIELAEMPKGGAAAPSTQPSSRPHSPIRQLQPHGQGQICT